MKSIQVHPEFELLSSKTFLRTIIMIPKPPVAGTM